MSFLLQVMSDKRNKWPLFRYTNKDHEDDIVTLFSIGFQFGPEGYVARFWRHVGDGERPVNEHEPHWVFEFNQHGIRKMH